MQLAIFHPKFGTLGGAEVLAAAEARALREAGIDARIVTGEVDDERWGARLEGIPVDVFRQRSLDRLVAWTKVGRLRLHARRARPLLAKADVVIAHNYPCNAMLGALPLRALRLWQVNEPPRTLHLEATIPVLAARARALGANAPDHLTRVFALRLASWDSRTHNDRALAVRQHFDIDMTARLDGLYAISAYARDMARRVHGRCSDVLVYPPLEDGPAPPARRGIRRDGLQLLVQSRLETVKNVETVMTGFAAYARTHAGAHCHVVGDGGDARRLRTVGAALASGRITFHGFLEAPALAALRASCDVFALLPVDEPFGMVFSEAMAQGLLCIGPDHGGPAEILEGGGTGWVVDAFSPDQVADALARIAGLDDATADARRQAAADSVAARFSKAAMVSALRRVIREAGGPD